VVDDDAVFQRAMSMRLTSFGYDVMCAEDGSAAVSAFHQSRPDLILLDINFPPDVAHGGGLTWDGFLILSWLRRAQGAQGVPVIAITAGDAEQYREQCRQAGLDYLFPKPVDHEALVATMKTLLSQTEPNIKKQVRPAPAFRSKRRILFVDDDGGWRRMAVGHLGDQGYEVVTTESGEGALSEAARVRPDVIVLDLKLGGQSGLNVMRLLAVAHPAVPILVYTGMAVDQAALDELLNQGASQCLRKRSMEELITAVGTALESPPRKVMTAERPRIERRTDASEEELESVLIVEGDHEFSETLQAFLESHPFSVTCVPDGTEALRQIAALDFDLILSDVVLPEATGEVFYREVERIKPDLCRRFVFMTGHYADPKTDAFIRQVGALMLWKPFPLGDVLSAAQTVRRHRFAGRSSRRPMLVNR